MPPRRTTPPGQAAGDTPFFLTRRGEEILTAVHFYAGGVDEQSHQYLYRFSLPRSKPGGSVKVYTLGSRGRKYLEREVGQPVEWSFRPDKVKHLSFGHLMHQLTLTRALVAAAAWGGKQPEFRLAKTRISYELAKMSVRVTLETGRKTQPVMVVPDAWLLFEQLEDGAHASWYPVLLEIDRGTEYQQKFKQHIRARIEFVRSGAYEQVFSQRAVRIAYATTGETAAYQETRRTTMCTWTQEVLAEAGRERWASVFRFCRVGYEEMYDTPLFSEPLWYRPDQDAPVPLFAP